MVLDGEAEVGRVACDGGCSAVHEDGAVVWGLDDGNAVSLGEGLAEEGAGGSGVYEGCGGCSSYCRWEEDAARCIGWGL
jgi:hypothetical protein